jgi:hypothetical protein
MVELGGSSLHEKDHESCLEDTFFTCNLFIPYVFHGCDFRVTLPRFHATRGSTMAVLHGKEQLLELQISFFAKPYHENPFC